MKGVSHMEEIIVVFSCDGHSPYTKGKETPYIKSLGRRIKENEFNKPVEIKMGKHLQRSGIVWHQMAPTDEDTSLKERTTRANQLYWQYCQRYGRENVRAVYVSIHFNAVDGKFDGPGKDPEGFSVHIQPGHRNKAAGKLAKFILDQLSKGTKQKNRGIVEQNLHITRETAMPAVLTENGFMDNEREALLMLDPSFQNEVAEEHARGICDYFGIPFVEEQRVSTIAKEPEEELTVAQAEILQKQIDELSKTVKQFEAFNKVFYSNVSEINNAVSRVLRRFEQKDPALAAKWRKEFLNKELSLVDAVGILFVAVDRGYITGLTQENIAMIVQEVIKELNRVNRLK